MISKFVIKKSSKAFIRFILSSDYLFLCLRVRMYVCVCGCICVYVCVYVLALQNICMLCMCLSSKQRSCLCFLNQLLDAGAYRETQKGGETEGGKH